MGEYLGKIAEKIPSPNFKNVYGNPKTTISGIVCLLVSFALVVYQVWKLEDMDTGLTIFCITVFLSGIALLAAPDKPKSKQNCDCN